MCTFGLSGAKIPREDTQRDTKKERNGGGESEKKARNFGQSTMPATPSHKNGIFNRPSCEASAGRRPAMLHMKKVERLEFRGFGFGVWGSG